MWARNLLGPLLLLCQAASAVRRAHKTTPDADGRSSKVPKVGDPQVMQKLEADGLHDVSDFMQSFEKGQVVADSVKCDMCQALVTDMVSTAVSYTTLKKDEAAADDGDPTIKKQLASFKSIADLVEQNIPSLCAQGTRFSGIYDLRPCASMNDTHPCHEDGNKYSQQKWVVVREEDMSIGAVQTRQSDPSRDWQSDVHTVLCARYWRPVRSSCAVPQDCLALNL